MLGKFVVHLPLRKVRGDLPYPKAFGPCVLEALCYNIIGCWERSTHSRRNPPLFYSLLLVSWNKRTNNMQNIIKYSTTILSTRNQRQTVNHRNILLWGNCWVRELKSPPTKPIGGLFIFLPKIFLENKKVDNVHLIFWLFISHHGEENNFPHLGLIC